LKIELSRVRLSLRYREVMFPLDLDEVFDGIQTVGYAVTLDNESIPSRSDARIDVTGPIGKKGEATFDINMDRAIFGVSTPEPRLTIEEFQSVEGSLNSLLDMSNSVWFYEAILNGGIKTKEATAEILEGFGARLQIFEQLGEIWGEPVTNFGLRLSPPGRIANQEEFFDVKIVPNLRRGDEFGLDAVYRSAEKTKCLRFVERFEDHVSKTIELMGGA